VEALGNETFEIDTELTRDAIKAGVWSRTCSEMADREEDAVWRPGVEPLATKPGEDATAVLAAHADTDIDYLAAARRRFIAVEGAPLGAKVELDDVWRFMPRAWDQDANRWLWAATEIRELEDAGARVIMVRQFGSDEQVRGD